MILPNVQLEQLNPALADFLTKGGYMAEGPAKDSVPVYLDCGHGNVAKVSGAYCPSNAKGKFVESRPAELFVAGIAMLVVTKMGYVSSPDRRRGRQVMATVQGWMEVGEDPIETAWRETFEELVVYFVDHVVALSGKTQIVPVGVEPKGRIEYLNVELTGTPVEHGHLMFVGVNKNTHQPGVIEFMFIWDLRELGDLNLCFVQSKEMPDGSILGSNFLVYDIMTGALVGIYSAQQGFFPPDATRHSALVNMLSYLRP